MRAQRGMWDMGSEGPPYLQNEATQRQGLGWANGSQRRGERSRAARSGARSAHTPARPILA
jgi:hypothetical protein